MMPDSSQKSDAEGEGRLRVSEIFRSIQGESSWAGLPCVFIRLAGCSVGCAFCDTAYARDGGIAMTVAEAVEKCLALSGRLVEVTGGEPLEQAACPRLVRGLLEHGMTVLVETSGTLPISGLPAEAIKIMDLKCPSSGVCAKNDWSNIAALGAWDEVKFVIADRTDYEWSRDVIGKHDLTARCGEVLVGCVFGAIEPQRVVAWILEDGLDVRFQVQLQKIIWAPGARGV